MKGPFRADHVGSFLRPPALMAARKDFADGKATRDELTAVEDEHIRTIVAMQENAGIQAVTDGDFRRTSWSGDFLAAIEGVELETIVSPSATTGYTDTPKGGKVENWMPPSAPRTVSKLKLPAGGIQHKSFAFLNKTTSRTAKVTVPSPSMLHFRGGRDGVDQDAYPEMDAFFDDVAEVWRDEVADLAALGCTYFQMDDTNMAYLCDPDFRERVKGLGEDPDDLPHRYAQLINDAIKDRPDDMAATVHLCRGNSFSRGHAEGGYEPVVEIMFNEFKIDGFFLEYDDARSGDFSPLRFVPKGPKIVLGVVTSKFGELESKDDIKRRIDEACKYMPLEQMCLSPQCGFASHTGGNLLSEDEQAAKLAFIVEMAEEIWGTAQ